KHIRKRIKNLVEHRFPSRSSCFFTILACFLPRRSSPRSIYRDFGASIRDQYSTVQNQGEMRRRAAARRPLRLFKRAHNVARANDVMGLPALLRNFAAARREVICRAALLTPLARAFDRPERSRRARCEGRGPARSGPFLFTPGRAEKTDTTNPSFR